jgi:hypothetical protein
MRVSRNSFFFFLNSLPFFDLFLNKMIKPTAIIAIRITGAVTIAAITPPEILASGAEGDFGERDVNEGDFDGDGANDEGDREGVTIPVVGCIVTVDGVGVGLTGTRSQTVSF